MVSEIIQNMEKCIIRLKYHQIIYLLSKLLKLGFVEWFAASYDILDVYDIIYLLLLFYFC